MPTEKYKYGWDDPRAGIKITDYDIEQARIQVRKFIKTRKEIMETGIDKTLSERGSRYGAFKDQAQVAQAIKKAFETGRNWNNLPADSREALETIATKISRILHGDPEYADSWHDIVGYAKLVDDRINGIVK